MKENLKGEVFALPGSSVIPGTQWAGSCASTAETARGTKSRIITKDPPGGVFQLIRLKRTDTTLDLSQKAKRAKEKRKERKSKLGWGRARFYTRSKAVRGGAQSVTGRILKNRHTAKWSHEK